MRQRRAAIAIGVVGLLSLVLPRSADARNAPVVIPLPDSPFSQPQYQRTSHQSNSNRRSLALPIARSSEVMPTDHWVYAALDDLKALNQFDKGLPQEFRPVSRPYRARTRAELAQEVARQFRQLSLHLEESLSSYPEFQPTLKRLLREFVPELRAQGLDAALLLDRVSLDYESQGFEWGGEIHRPFADVPSEQMGDPGRAVDKLVRAGIIVGYPRRRP